MSSSVKTSKFTASRALNRLRIIGGQWRSRILEFPTLPGLRPTPDRVRETLFNWLGQSMAEKRCLDLFAGSGALGFEAASRGASKVTMVENARPALAALRLNRERLDAAQCQIVAQDALKWVATTKGTFDVIFLDPPFASDLLKLILPKLVECLDKKGIVYAEWQEPIDELITRLPSNPWRVLRSGKAGAVHFALLSLTEIHPNPSEVAS